MTFAVYLPLLVDLVPFGGDHLGFEREIAGGQADAVELQLQISLAPEVAGILRSFQMAHEIAAAGKSLLSELGDAAQMAQHGIAHVHRVGGQVRFVEGALQKSSGGQDDVTSARVLAKGENQT